MSGEDLSAIVRDILPKVMELVRELFKLVELKGIDPVKAPLRNEKLGGVFAKHGVSLAYLFGSRARGLAVEGSDYDIAVLFGSSDITVINEVKLAVDLAKALGVPSDRVDVVALDRADLSLVAEVLEHGIPIYYRSLGELRSWERKSYLKLLGLRDLDAIYLGRLRG